MNKYLRGLVVIPCRTIKMLWTKLFHVSCFNGPVLCQVSPYTEITMDKGAKFSIGKDFKMRDDAKIRIRKNATCIVGSNTAISSNNIITCRKYISIGNNYQLSPNVLIYDHDFCAEGGIWEGKYKESPIEIGDNCVVGAGCVLNGEYPEGSVIIQQRETEVLR